MTAVNIENLYWLGAGFLSGIFISLLLAKFWFFSFKEKLTDLSGETLKNLSNEALQDNSKTFLELADKYFSLYVSNAKKDLDGKGNDIIKSVEPVRLALEKYEAKIGLMEREREKSFGSLSAQIIDMARTQQTLQRETGKLVKALRVPHVRGRWGEITLRRVAEIAGMASQCDFVEQESISHARGTTKGSLRPDMVVHLPGGRNIVIDSKVPLSAYLDSLEADSEEKVKQFLTAHADQVQVHINKLSSKEYWRKFTPTPEFVVLFIPGENYFSAALASKPDLIEKAIEKNVVLATPTTLISLLKAVSYGWRLEKSAENAKKISELGNEIFQRLSSMSEVMNKLGKDIDRAASTYNKTIGTLEKRVLVSARKFKSLGISSGTGKDIPEIEPVETKIRVMDRD